MKLLGLETFLMDTGKHVTITSTGDETATRFQIVGTDRKGNNIEDVIFGGAANVTVASFLEFKTVTQINVKGQATQGVIDLGYMNSMFTPSGWGTADIDGSGGNGAVQVTPTTLYGAPKNLDAQTALDAANAGNVLTIKADNSISADNTISIWNGMYNVTFTCGASGANGDFEFNKGANAGETAANLHAKINAFQEQNLSHSKMNNKFLVLY